MDEYELKQRMREARSSPDPRLLKGDWRPDYALDDIEKSTIDLLAEQVREHGGLEISNPELVFCCIDHGMVEMRPVAARKLWSACIFPLTMRGYRAIILCEQGFGTATALGELYRNSTTPDWPLERKINAILLEQARWNWVTLKRRKMTYSLPDALNNDILFIVKENEDVWLPDDDVPLFRLRYEPAKKHKDPFA